MNYRRRLIDTSSSSSSSEDSEENVLENMHILRRVKIYRMREQCLEKYDDLEFFDRFRLTKPVVLALLQQITPLIALPSNRGGCIQPPEQLLVTLRFYATGSFLITAGDFIGISKTSTCRIVRRVSTAIASLRPQYVKMYDNNEEMERAAEEFYRIACFPKVIGAIDGSLIRIDSVGGMDAEIYRCRKGYFALNIQTVCDANLRIRDIVARWPGSSHDQTIFNNSNIKNQFENRRYGKYLLIGDSGYQIEPYLMTKLHHVDTAAQNLYNESLIRTRNTVERLYGVWKRRFPILRLGMRVHIDTIKAIIVATAVLHNIAVDMNENFPLEWLENLDDENEIENEEPAQNAIGRRGDYVRQLIIAEHFERL